MRFLSGLFCGILLASLLYGWDIDLSPRSDKFQEKWENKFSVVPQTEQEKAPEGEYEQQVAPWLEEQREAGTLKLGMSQQELVELLGQPVRMDPTPYGYTWWIFDQDWRKYIQVGIRDGVVNTFYTNSTLWGWAELFPGMAKEAWEEHFFIKPEVSMSHPLGIFTFTLTSEEQRERPLMIEGDAAIQLYVDLHNNEKISGIRVMDTLTLLMHKPYALKYIGELPELAQLTEKDWQAIERANEQQVFTLVNIVRRQHGLSPLVWDEQVAYVARKHSADMFTHNYFDHDSPSHGDLKARLESQQVSFMLAGENIAWNYVDAPDAHEGWLNSPGHRQNILQEDFTHLGVGVVKKYYTQNFIAIHP